jgi:hypothetical protein
MPAHKKLEAAEQVAPRLRLSDVTAATLRGEASRRGSTDYFFFLRFAAFFFRFGAFLAAPFAAIALARFIRLAFMSQNPLCRRNAAIL